MTTRTPGKQAAQVPKLVVPSAPPADDAPAGLERPQGDDQPGNGPDDLGDLFALADESYRDAVWYVWRRRLPGDAVDKRSNPNAPIYVAKVVGPVDIDDLAKMTGGGSFRLCGYRGGEKFIERPFEVDGPRKVYPADVKAEPTAAAPVAAVPDQSQAIAAVIERMFDKLEQKLSTSQQSNGSGNALTVKDAIELAKMMRGEPQASPDAAVVQTYVGILKDGIALGAQREAAGGTDWAAVLEKGTPLLEKLVTGILTRRQAPPMRRAPGAQPARSASHAEVVQEPAATAPVDPPAGESPRMTAVVEGLARAVDEMGTENEIEPADYAATVEHILNPAECSMLRITTTDTLMGELASVADRFPSLATPQARAFVDAVLTALRSEPNDAE